jgi:hypothetical protein
MTVNQVIKRIRELTLGHKQIRTFRKGLVSDFFADKTAKYPAACLQDLNGTISLTGKATTLNYRLFLTDLVHVSQDTKENEDDVLSDMVSIAMDLLAQFNNGNYDDWAVSTDSNLEFIVEGDNDLHAGIVFDFSVRIMYKQNICQVPTDITNYTPTDESMKYIYDVKYTANGAEGNTLDIPELKGKKILFITRGNAIIYKASSSPASNEYSWNDDVVGLGAATINNEPFLILYRNY